MGKKKAKKKTSKKAAPKAKKKATKKTSKKRAPRVRETETPKIIVMKHKRWKFTGREVRNYKMFRGYIEVPSDKPRDVRLFRRLGYDQVPASQLKKVHDEVNQRKADEKALRAEQAKLRAKRLVSEKANPNTVLGERDREAAQIEKVNKARAAQQKKAVEKAAKAPAKGEHAKVSKENAQKKLASEKATKERVDKAKADEDAELDRRDREQVKANKEAAKKKAE